MPIFVICCITCSPYMIWHLGQWKKSLVCNNPQEGPGECPNEDALQFMKLLEDANQPCYVGCKHFIKLSVIVHLYHMNCLNGWTNKSFTMLLQFCLIFILQMLSCQTIVIRLRRLLRIWAWVMRRLMLVLKIVFYIGRRMPTLKLVQTMEFQEGK